jgi:hypothetical protein
MTWDGRKLFLRNLDREFLVLVMFTRAGSYPEWVRYFTRRILQHARLQRQQGLGRTDRLSRKGNEG